MEPELELHRRTLLSAYHRYLAAERALRLAQAEARSWFPIKDRPSVPPIGHPGSPLRRLNDRRDRAVLRLQLLQIKFHETRSRVTRSAATSDVKGGHPTARYSVRLLGCWR